MLKFTFWRFDLWFLKFSTFPLLKGTQTPPSNNKSVTVTNYMINFQFRKWIWIFRIPSRIKAPQSSQFGLSLSKKCQSKSVHEIQRALRPSAFFWNLLKNKSVFLHSLSLFQLSVGYALTFLISIFFISAGLITRGIRRFMDLRVSEQLKGYPGPVLFYRRTRDEIITTQMHDLSSNRGNDLALDLIEHRWGQ